MISFIVPMACLDVINPLTKECNSTIAVEPNEEVESKDHERQFREQEKQRKSVEKEYDVEETETDEREPGVITLTQLDR